MAWKEVSTMTQRLELVQLAMGEINVSELCRRFGVSRQTAYKWMGRFKAGGVAAMADRSRRPHRSPGRTAKGVEARAVALRHKHPTWGGRKIRARLETLAEAKPADSAGAALPAVSTFTDIFRRHGLIVQAAPGAIKPFVRFEREHPNELWQMDFKGHFATNTGRCHPLTVLDDHSRFNLVLSACADEKTQTVKEKLIAAFRKYGLPVCILCDNGPPFGGKSDHGLTPLSVWLMRLGVHVTHGRPYHPQTQGKEERFHRTLKADVISGQAFNSVIHVQRRFDPFRREYNFHRPHEALAMQTPSQRWRPSPRSFPAMLPSIEYDSGDHVRKVQANGEISFQGHNWKVADCLFGESVALRATTTDGCYEVRFCSKTIAHLDLRTNRVRS
jgi:transposase InsO family protein